MSQFSFVLYEQKLGKACCTFTGKMKGENIPTERNEVSNPTSNIFSYLFMDSLFFVYIGDTLAIFSATFVFSHCRLMGQIFFFFWPLRTLTLLYNTYVYLYIPMFHLLLANWWLENDYSVTLYESTTRIS